jgi:hypothetical protein
VSVSSIAAGSPQTPAGSTPAPSATSATSGSSSTATPTASTPAAPAADAPTQYTAQVNADVATLASGSGTSLDDQINAYVDLQDLIFNNAILYKAGNQQDLTNAINAFSNSDFAKQLQSVTNQFQIQGLAEDTTASAISNPAQANLDNINSFSEDNQKLLYVSLAGNANFSTFDDWKASLTQAAADPSAANTGPTTVSIAQIAQRFGLAGGATTPSVTSAATVSLSAAARVKLASDPSTAGASGGDTAAQTAVQTLATPAPTDGKADAALTILQNGAAARAATQANAAKQGPNVGGTPLIGSPQKPYASGAQVDTLA